MVFDPERVTIVDVTDESTFGRIPPCADPSFDHRSCDYWEDADRGSKAIRLAWLEPRRTDPEKAVPSSTPANPFLADLEGRMPRFMLPRFVEVFDDLPRNENTMRVKKHELRARGVGPSTWDREPAQT